MGSRQDLQRAILILTAVLSCTGSAWAQSPAALDKITGAAELCNASIRVSDGDRPKLWETAGAIGLQRDAPDQPYMWTDDTVTMRVAPGLINGITGCTIKLSGSMRPTAIISAVAGWARTAGYVAANYPDLLFSMQTDGHYLDAQRTPDGMTMEFGWRDD